MTKKHFEHMASMVRAILTGEWTNDLPSWANVAAVGNIDYLYAEPKDLNYLRAAQTAEAFIMLAQAYNPRFDTARFLIACGLASAPAKGKRS